MRGSNSGDTAPRGRLRKAGPEVPSGQCGFTLVELFFAIMAIGALLAVGTLSISQISAGMKLAGAMKQVEEAINRAKTAARQENVTYLVRFYSSASAHPNSYEFYCNTEEWGQPASWKMKPVDRSVTGERVTVKNVEGEEHCYVEMSNGA